jgi:hypothetical protein
LAFAEREADPPILDSRLALFSWVLQHLITERRFDSLRNDGDVWRKFGANWCKLGQRFQM